MNFIFWSMASHGSGLSGGDRIYIEFAKMWSKKYPLQIVTWSEGVDMMARSHLAEGQNLSFRPIPISKAIRSSFFICYLYRILVSLFAALTYTVKNPSQTFVYSASEFWMDSLPCLVLKLRYPSLKWIATWYQTAPSPLKGFSSGTRVRAYHLNALLLWLTQLPVKPLIAKLADFVLVNNDLEKKVFPSSRVIVVLGAVNTDLVDVYLSSHSSKSKKYAAVFQGRFHAQKGVVELVDIWDLVTKRHPKAKLAMIGEGPLMSEVKKRIAQKGLEKNIDLWGYLFDGEQKFKVFSQSLLAVHPAFFDSGGMATAEAMAFGIPAVGFNLPAYDSYYPQGMIKVPVGDLNAFADAIVDLLKTPLRRNRLGRKAAKFIHEAYSWDHRAQEILQQIVERTDSEKEKKLLQRETSTNPKKSKERT